MTVIIFLLAVSLFVQGSRLRTLENRIVKLEEKIFISQFLSNVQTNVENSQQGK